MIRNKYNDRGTKKEGYWEWEYSYKDTKSKGYYSNNQPDGFWQWYSNDILYKQIYYI